MVKNHIKFWYLDADAEGRINGYVKFTVTFFDGRVEEYRTNQYGAGLWAVNHDANEAKQEYGTYEFNVYGLKVKSAKQKITRWFNWAWD